MLEANFYNVEDKAFPKFFGKLLETVTSKDNKVTIYCKDEKQVREIDEILWTYSQLSFLPHVTCFDNDKEDTQIYITCSNTDNYIKADFAFILTDHLPVGVFKKYFYAYNSKNTDTAKTLANRFQKVANFHQDAVGNWVKTNF